MAERETASRSPLALIALVVALVAGPGTAARAADTGVTTSHGLSIYGDLKYKAGFKHFDYVNPDAVEGWGRSARGSRDVRQSEPLHPERGARGKRHATLRDAHRRVLGRALLRVRIDRREHRDAGRPLLGRVQPPSGGALSRRQSHHGRRRHLDLPGAQDERPPVLSLLLRPGRQGRGRRSAEGEVHLRPGRQSGTARHHGPDARAVQGVLHQARVRQDDARGAARQRPLPCGVGGRGPLHRLQAREGLLGRQASGEGRHEQLRHDPVRLLPRQHGGAGSVQGGPVRLPPGEQRQELGHRVRACRPSPRA